MDRIYPVDLQSHSIYSDGTDTPEELIAKAAAAGIRVLAVTDHDSVMGVAAAQAAGMKADVQILPAIEFSTAGEHERDFLDINILGYAIDPTDPTLLEMLDRVIKSRVEQKIRQVKRLHTYGLHVPVEEVLAWLAVFRGVRISHRLPSNIIPISFPPSLTSSNSTWPPMRRTPHTYTVASACGWRMPLN